MTTAPSFGIRFRSRAFTLIELLVSLAILSLMVVMFARVTGDISNSWHRSSEKMDNLTKARAFLNRMQVDIDGMILRDDLPAFLPLGKSNLSFYTTRKGTDSISGTTDRPLSFVQFAVTSGSGTAGKIQRSDTTIPWAMPLSFANPPTPVAVAPINFPVPADPPLSSPLELSSGIVGFKWAFLTDEGTYSTDYYYPADTRAHKAIGITVAIAVVDDRASQILEDTGKFNDLISKLDSAVVTPEDTTVKSDWSPKANWEDALGLRPGSSGDIARSFPPKFLRSIRIFQRTFLFPRQTL